jgi:DHA2 family multidrug resistance protein
MNQAATFSNTPTSARWLIIIAVMSATLIQVLDSTIVNVALPHMQGSLGAAPDQITWTLTSYLVASAIFMPLTGYFTDLLGRKKYLLICIAGFTLSSALCGASLSLFEIVLFRLLQGAFGAALVPLSQGIITSVYSKKEQGKAMAIWGTGVMVGPILGPTLGGYITEFVSWRWTFYVNVPVGLFAFLLAWQVVPDSPKKQRAMDWRGLLLLSFAIGAFQYFLDRGSQQDWFSGRDIQLAVLIGIISLVGFLFYTLQPQAKNTAIFDIRIFKDRNFALASSLLAILGLGMYGSMVIQPLMLENLLNFPVVTTGLAMAPRGISGMISMIIVAKIINRVDPRWLTATGILLSALGTAICTTYSANLNINWIIWPLFLQGFGLGMIFVPLGTMAFATLPDSMKVEAAGLFSLLRTIGSSAGISITITVLTRHTQIAWNQIGGLINPYRPAVGNYLQTLHMQLNNPLAPTLLGQQLAQQAQMIAFINTYAFIMWSFLLMLPLVFLLRKPENQPSALPLAVAE